MRVPLRLDAPDSDPDLPARQQAALLAAAMRTLALPVGRGAFTLGTLQGLPTEPVPMPLLQLSGRTLEGGAGSSGAVVNLDLGDTQQEPGERKGRGGWVCGARGWGPL